MVCEICHVNNGVIENKSFRCTCILSLLVLSDSKWIGDGCGQCLDRTSLRKSV